MKVIQKPHSPKLVPLDRTYQGGASPLPPHRAVLKDSKYFRRKPKRVIKKK